MANPLLQFINNRFIQPAVNAGVEKALAQGAPPAYGVASQPPKSLAESIGQPHDANYALLYALYKLNTDVSSCVHKWAGGVTGGGWRITTMDEDAKLTDGLKREIEDITRWLNNPNPSKLFESMIYEGVTHWGIVGNFYWYVSIDAKGRPLEIWPMHPALTKVKATTNGEITGYVMQPTSGEAVHFDADEVLDFPLPNPTHDLYGESPLELVLEEAGIDLQALRSNKAIFQNGLNPSAVALMDEGSKIDEGKQLTAQIKQAHAGAENQHKVMVLSKIRDFKPWTMTNRDLEFLKLRDLATSKVTTAYRIPKVLLGHHNAGDYATTKFLIRDTYAHVYRPMQRIIEAIITERLIHRFNAELRFELIAPDASDPDDIRKDQMQAKASGILTADEVRADSFDKEPLEAEANETPAKNEQKPDLDAGDSAEDAPTTDKSLRKALSADELTSLADSRAAEMDALADSIEPSVVDYFSSQEALTLARLSGELTAAGLDELIDADTDERDSTLLAILLGTIAAALHNGATAAQLQVGITLGFNQTNPFIQDYLNTQAGNHIKGINQTTRDQLRGTLIEGIEAEEGIEQLRARVEAVFTQAKGTRANTIARTETAQAFSYANKQTLDIMYERGVINARTWLTAQDDRVRPTHAELHGYTIRYRNTYPGELEPGQEINCRCTEIGVMATDEELS